VASTPAEAAQIVLASPQACRTVLESLTRPPVASGPGARARYARSPKPPPGADGRLRGARARPSRFVALLSVEASTIDAVRDRETYRRRLVAAVRRRFVRRAAR
jgi:hypothetical protein